MSNKVITQEQLKSVLDLLLEMPARKSYVVIKMLSEGLVDEQESKDTDDSTSTK
jgi:hypothetical protein